jgi:hypothetical protein
VLIVLTLSVKVCVFPKGFLEPVDLTEHPLDVTPKRTKRQRDMVLREVPAEAAFV